MLQHDELGKALYQELNQPDRLDLYLVGVSEYRNENDDEFDVLIDALDRETKVRPHRIADAEYERDDVEQLDLFEHDYPDDSLLVVPDTYTFGRGGPTATDRYREFIDLMPDTGLDGILHLDVEEDLSHTPERMDDHTSEDLIDDLTRSYQKRDGRVYVGKTVEAEGMETALLSKLY